MSGHDFWKERRVLITGINGFVGGNLAKACCTEGAAVVGLIRNLQKDSLLFHEGLADSVHIILGDITDKELLRKVIVEERITCCFHLAAQVEVGIAKTYPFLTWETNVRGTYALMEAIRDSGEKIQATIIASSDKAYGNYEKEKLPYREDYPLIPVYPYDVSKACADMIARSYASDLYSLPIIITRFCNLYGPGQMNFSALIPDAVRSALGYSRFIPRGNGLHIRDYMYIGDAVSLYMLLAEALSSNRELGGEIFNAGTNQPRLVKDVVQEIYTILNREEDYRQIDPLWADRQAAGEIEFQFMDYEKVNRRFGWKPSVDFNSGLKETIQWYEQYFRRNYGTHG